uniref:Uncharacterized protein n=1 Tax=Caenorhabditis tropicalis TaxID=1561998 RepID=A0A1I7TDT2_9PELO
MSNKRKSATNISNLEEITKINFTKILITIQQRNRRELSKQTRIYRKKEYKQQKWFSQIRVENGFRKYRLSRIVNSKLMVIIKNICMQIHRSG